MMGKDTSRFSSPDGEVARTVNSRIFPGNGRDWRIIMGISLAWDDWRVVCLSNLKSKPSWGEVSPITPARETIYLLVG
jgi:hypothetical protein